MEPWISVAEKRGARVIMESHSSRSEGAADELDGPTLRKLFDAEGRAAEAIQKHPAKYAHYLLEEAGGELDLADLKLARILNGPRAIHAGPLRGKLPVDLELGSGRAGRYL
jgi:hypothetical protein